MSRMVCPRCEGQKYDRGSCQMCGNKGYLDDAHAYGGLEHDPDSGPHPKCLLCQLEVVRERAERAEREVKWRREEQEGMSSELSEALGRAERLERKVRVQEGQLLAAVAHDAKMVELFDEVEAVLVEQEKEPHKVD